MGQPYNRKDHLYNQAKSEGYRSRSAYKLIELNDRFKLMKKGSKVVDLGCWPGGWLQVIANIIGQQGLAIGIDLKKIEAFKAQELKAGAASVQFIEGDVSDPIVFEQLLELCGGAVDAVFSDMSPKISGIRDRDIAQSVSLVETAVSFARKALRPGGHFVAKTFQSQDAQDLARELRQYFKRFQIVNAESSRKSSREIYFVGLSLNNK